MRKIIKFGFVSVLLVLIGFSTISPVLAANEWLVEEGDELVFDLTGWDEDEITADGSFTLTIEAIDTTGELTYSIITDFDIDEDNLDDVLEVENGTTIDIIAVSFIVVLVFSEDSFNDYVDALSDEIELLEDSFDTIYGDNDSITFSIEELEYGVEYSVEDSELEESWYYKLQWDEKGIIEHWEMTYIEDGEKNGMLIKASGFGIPSFPMEVFIAIFAISTLGIIIRSKKHK